MVENVTITDTENTIRNLLDGSHGDRVCNGDHPERWRTDCHQCTAHIAKRELSATIARMLTEGFLAELPAAVDNVMGRWISHRIPAKEYGTFKDQLVGNVKKLLKQTLYTGPGGW